MRRKYVIIAMIAAIILATILICSFFNKKNTDIQIGYNKLLQNESVSVETIESQLDAIRQEETRKQLEAEQEQIKQKPTKKEILGYKKLFENSIVMGDSIIEGLLDFRYLYSSSVICHRGWSVAQAKPMVRQVIQLHPVNIFMSFGVNDMPYFNGDEKEFRNEFKKRIKEIKKSLPNARIFINSILPVKKFVIKEKPVYKHISRFNKQLQELSQEMGAGYIDNGEIVKNLDNVYETDGIHMRSQYYPYWLKNMAIKAGLL